MQTEFEVEEEQVPFAHTLYILIYLREVDHLAYCCNSLHFF